jgi:hypothetical protein
MCLRYALQQLTADDPEATISYYCTVSIDVIIISRISIFKKDYFRISYFRENSRGKLKIVIITKILQRVHLKILEKTSID